jgi:hypothetical protein
MLLVKALFMTAAGLVLLQTDRRADDVFKAPVCRANLAAVSRNFMCSA